ncbi:carbohydrate binding domain-containing protein [Tamlana flava]|uniref:carbohydrate binding domain-containing protein n=1 Tax=Tamlana flava TaxID=3158572 RepID=UPI00351B4B26
MKTLLKIFKYSVLLWIVTFFMGCEEDDALLLELDAAFTYTVNIDTGTVTFINISENAYKYEWSFGDGTSSTLFNPVKTFENGTYTVSLKAMNVAGASDTFESEITILIPEIASLPISFDGANTKYEAQVFGGVAFDIVDNPDPSGANPNTSKVGEITNSGSQWEGFYFDLGSPLDLSTLKTIKMLFWSDAPISILLKLEEGTSGNIETTANHRGAGWEEIMFTFNSAASYSRLTMFVDGPGTASGKFYIDDITQIETPPDPCKSETMQSLVGADFNLTFMEDPSASIIEDGADFSWIDNPDFDNGVNKSCKVGQITKLGNNPWDNNQIDLDSKLDFTSNTGLKIKVWSARANTEVRIKLEEIGNPSNSTEQFVTTSVTSAWEELMFPFTGADSGKFNKIVIFFDLNANNTDTYYFDDLVLYGTGSGVGPFDDGLLTNGDFENGGTAWSGNALNVQMDGGNSYNLADVTAAGNPFDVNLSQVVAIEQGKNYTLTFDASSDRNRTILAGIGLNQDPWTAATETVSLTTTTQTFTLNLSSADFGIANSRVLFDMGAELGVVVIDNVSLICTNCN